MPIVDRNRGYLDLIEPRNIVSLGPDSKLAGNHFAVVKHGQHQFVVQPNREFVVFGGNFEGLPMVPYDVGIYTCDLLGHSAGGQVKPEAK